MKNAMKKLMSLLLVAVLLVSAVPFQADAAAGDVHNLTLQDGNATLANVQVVEGQFVPTLPTPAPVAGKKFAGWTYGSTLLTTSTVWSWGDGTAYANWTQGVALTPHYGEGVAYANLPSVVYVYEGELIGNALPTPTRDGYTFKGWTYGNTQLTPATTWSFGANGGSIYAQWEQNATGGNGSGNSTGGNVVGTSTAYFYNANGSSHWSINVTNGSTIDVADNSTSTQITYAEQHVGTKTGYTFAGWQRGNGNECLTTAQAAAVIINGDTHFYPVWTQNGSTSDGNSGNNSGSGNTTTGTTTTTYNVEFYNANGKCHWNIDVAAGSTIDVADNNAKTQIGYAEANVGTKDGYTFKGWQKNGQGEILSTATVAQVAVYADTVYKPAFEKTGSDEVNNYYGDEAMDDVWLYIYVNADMSSPAKRVLLNNYTIASDGILNKAEVLTVVDDYYKASNANTGIIWKGMYAESAANLRSATALQFIAGDLYDSISGINAKRYEGPVIIKARVTGVSAISTATADTSNPKTGDEIYMAVTALGLSGAALATAMYFFTKKRVVK